MEVPYPGIFCQGCARGLESTPLAERFGREARLVIHHVPLPDEPFDAQVLAFRHPYAHAKFFVAQ